MENLNEYSHAMEEISLQRDKECVIKSLQAKCFDKVCKQYFVVERLCVCLSLDYSMFCM